MTEDAHIMPRFHNEWLTRNGMYGYARGSRPGWESNANLARLRPDLHRAFDKRAFALVPKSDDAGQHHLVVHFFSLKDGVACTAADIHNRKAHSLDPIAPEILFARFALTVFAQLQEFLLLGDWLRISVIERGNNAEGHPAWITRQLEMDRAQLHDRYVGGGSRQSETQPGDYWEGLSSEDRYNEVEEERGRCRIRSWLAANAAETDHVRIPQRRRTSERRFPPDWIHFGELPRKSRSVG
jgi:hypothetical protein